MFDVVNEQLISEGKEPIAFDHDAVKEFAVCVRLYQMVVHTAETRCYYLSIAHASFKNGDIIVVEPWRSAAFPVIKDLAVDRSSFDRIISGGFVL